MRIGCGFDAHRFISDVPLILGGVEIPHTHGLEAHSDGDAVIHAICDAILGALALGDIGMHFPDTDATHKGQNSRYFLTEIMKMVATDGWQIGNIDCTIIAEKPKMKQYYDSMRANIAKDVNAEISQISIKASTTEKMGFIGRGEGIAVESVVLLTKKEKG